MARAKQSFWLNLVLLWLAWGAILYGFQTFVVARLDLVRPDNVLEWTARRTQDDVLKQTPDQVKYYRRDLRVAFDSGYYLSIATVGYDDPEIPVVDIPDGRQLSWSYSFPPMYPLLIKAVLLVLSILPLPSTNLVVYAALLVALFGTLGAIFALDAITKGNGGTDNDGFRTAFYLLIFPSGFFLAMAYTEGLFVGLAFGCLAVLGRKKWFLASVLASGAILTRTVGVGLVLSIVTAVILDTWANWETEKHSAKILTIKAASLLVPVAVFGIWYFSPLGQKYALVEHYKFGRQVFALSQSWESWSSAFASFAGENTQTKAYYVLELSSLGLAFIACLATLRRQLPLALFGLFVLFTAVNSAVAQGMIRYTLVVPSIPIFLGNLGRNTVFDRVWSLASILLLGVLLTLFTFDMWVA